jgi:PAS domain S-box-containing protein
VVTAVCFRLGVGALPTASLYLIVITLFALSASFTVAVALSIGAVALLNYFFIPPIYTLWVDADSAVELAALILVALVTSGLVSRSRQAARQLRERARLLDLTHDAVINFDLRRRITYWNRGAEQLYGWSADEALGQVGRELLHTRYQEPVADVEAKLLQTGSWQGEVLQDDRDGKTLVIDERILLETNESGELVGTLTTANDVTEQRRVEGEVQRGQAYLTQAQRLTRTGIWTYDALHRRSIYWSEEMFRIWGFDPEQGIPDTRAVWQRVHPEDREKVRARIENARRGLNPDVVDEYRIVLPDGAIRYLSVTNHPILDADGRVAEYLVTAVDFTERKTAEEALQRAQQALAQVTRLTMLGEVGASIAHEVNQPLAAIVNNANACLELMPSGKTGLDEIREALGDIVRDGKRASAIVERVRQIARRSPSARVPCRIADVVSEVAVLAAREVAARRMRVDVEIPGDLPDVLADAVELQQVLLNLVVNAMDAMESMAGDDRAERRVEIRARTEAHEGRPAVTVCVADRGIGLQPEDLSRLFEAFYTTKPRGMGLGLAISRSIVEAHGGRLWAESNLPRGAVFCFRIPAIVPPGPAEWERSKPDAPSG